MAERPHPVHGVSKIGRMPTRDDLFTLLINKKPLSLPPKAVVIKGPRSDNPTKPKDK
ncbi:hypothetical protein KBB12_01950 [Candidatus Woesebacteria bacterium]|nr:hypothetical protein [Candidatus Woesebacteria bacterium]